MFVTFNPPASKHSARGYEKTVLLELNNICKKNPLSLGMETSFVSQIFCTTVPSHDIPKLRTTENESLNILHEYSHLYRGCQLHATLLRVSKWQKFKSSRG